MEPPVSTGGLHLREAGGESRQSTVVSRESGVWSRESTVGSPQSSVHSRQLGFGSRDSEAFSEIVECAVCDFICNFYSVRSQ